MKRWAPILILVFVIGVLVSFGVFKKSGSPEAADYLPVSSPFHYTFNTEGVLEESSSMAESTSPYWWLNSGGRLTIQYNTGSTLRGDLLPTDPWRRAYQGSNPKDTDGGAHPQNLFRLISRSRWKNVRMEGSFRVLGDNWSDSENRNGSNGLFLLSRYQDQNNLYYAGIRVDGTAVIKKKLLGEYYILGTKQLSVEQYHEGNNSNLIPHNEWLMLRAETQNTSNGRVTIRLFMKRESDQAWEKLLEVSDPGATKTKTLTTEGSVGIRTDFMDVELKNITIEAM